MPDPTQPTTHHVPTPHGTLAIHSAGIPIPSSKPTLLLIHGNSSNSTIFRSVLASPLTTTHTILALDLPGHGESSDAPDPSKTYTQSDYASAALLTLQALHVDTVVVLGWSLGGHVALEMIPRATSAGVRIAGAMITGTPPIPQGGVATGFRVEGDGSELASFRERLDEAEIEAIARGSTGGPYEEWMLASVRRTDGRARRIMFEAMAGGRDSDQRGIVEGTPGVLIAVVSGREEPYVRTEYVRSLRFANLWRGQCFELDGLRHAPFWEDWDRFKPYLFDFVEDCSRG